MSGRPANRERLIDRSNKPVRTVRLPVPEQKTDQAGRAFRQQVTMIRGKQIYNMLFVQGLKVL
jgi:hypothetical protein